MYHFYEFYELGEQKYQINFAISKDVKTEMTTTINNKRYVLSNETERE